MIFDQHGVCPSHHEILDVVHDVGGAVDSQRRAEVEAWAEEAQTRLHDAGGCGLLDWLLEERSRWRGKKRQPVQQLINDIQPRLDRTDDPTYRAQGWQMGTGMIESTAQQPVGLRLKGPGMHWSEQGALAVTALRATDLNNRWHKRWHKLWTTLTLNA